MKYFIQPEGFLKIVECKRINVSVEFICGKRKFTTQMAIKRFVYISMETGGLKHCHLLLPRDCCKTTTAKAYTSVLS